MHTSSEKWTERGDTWICLYSRTFEFRTHLTLADLRALQTYHFRRVGEFTAVSQDAAADWFCERFGFRVSEKNAKNARKNARIM